MTAPSGMTLASAIDSSIMRLPPRCARLSRISTTSMSRKPMRAAGLFGALAVALGKLALGAVLQPADRGDHDDCIAQSSSRSASAARAPAPAHIFSRL